MNPLETLVRSGLSQWLEQLSNLGVSLDPDMAGKLAALDGRSMVIESLFPNECFMLRIEGGQIRVTAHADRASRAANVWVSGTLPSLISAFTRPDASTNDLTIDGDETVLLELRELITSWRPQLPAPAKSVQNARWAEGLFSAAELGIAVTRSLAQTTTDAVSRQAATGFATVAELDTFVRAIEHLRLRVDRLAANVERAGQSPDPSADG